VLIWSDKKHVLRIFMLGIFFVLILIQHKHPHKLSDPNF